MNDQFSIMLEKSHTEDELGRLAVLTRALDAGHVTRAEFFERWWIVGWDRFGIRTSPVWEYEIRPAAVNAPRSDAA